MIKVFACSIAALGLLSGVFASSIKWKSSYDAAVTEAKSTHRLLMVDFYTDWCGWCKKLDADTYSSAEVGAKAARFVPLKLNAEKEGLAQAKKYHVDGFPTILFLKPNGDLAWKIVGYMPPADFAHQMELANGVSTEFPKLQKQFETKQGDPVVDSKLIAYYSGLNDMKGLKSVFADLEKCPQDKATEQLGTGYNAAGDGFQNAGQFPDAIAAFSKTEVLGTPGQIVYARISLAQCYAQANNKDAAIAVLKKLIAMGPEADTYRETAKSMMVSLEKS